MAPSAPTRDRTRTAVVEAAARLLRDAGGDAVTTRAVAEAAGVQAPTLYRLFGDKDGLLEAVVEHELATFVAAKAAQVRAAAEAEDDPVEDLRAGWHRQVEFGLTHPAVFALLSDPARAARSAAARSGREVLAARVHRVALAGRLRVGERHAAELVHAAGTGAVLALLAVPPGDRDPALSTSMLDAILAQVLVDPAAPADGGLRPAAVALRAGVDHLTALTGAERRLLAEWLDRVVAAG
ncbi:TetR/AcrR family transcriptional regulator [Klenkia terrae]|uniref:Helix-turn-helix domain-containing protein n=1 Tax=Klenkia terrae TaxID=1052259 RepID=A0ABU8E4I6_9ACTN|nr:TetR/AcrR family transcriptional regulator [Klenkia terrae]SSC21860.1 TerD family protein [Klenkia terrae]